jgi:hypothetical protein
LEVAGPQISDLLHAASRIEHGGQKGVVANSLRYCPIDRFQDRFDLFPLQVVDGALWCPFEGDAENPLD